MKLLELVQNSPEWEAWRRTKIGASDCATILGRNPFSTPYKIWEQKVRGTKEFYNVDMQRGHDLEDQARRFLSELIQKDLKPVCAESEERPWQIASFDGFYQNGSEIACAEIKCPRENKLREIAITGLIPEYWMWQMQHQMSISGTNEIHFFAYSEKIHCHQVVLRNQQQIDILNQVEEHFYYNYLCSFNPPPLTETERQYVETVSNLYSTEQKI